MTIAYIGLGSNLDAPLQQVKQAFRELDDEEGIELLKVSSSYGSEPMGPKDQPDYVNAVAEIETSLSAADLLGCLQQIENRHGRVRERHWGPRTLDLDILLYGDLMMETETLTIPHVGISDRPFVAFPLLEIAPELEVPGLGKVSTFIQKMNPAMITQL